MKHLKTRLTILLCVLSIMLLCFGLVACGTKTYKVALDYNQEQGTVTLSPEAENNEYEEGTELTVTVKPNEGFALDTLTLSTEDRAATPNNEGKFVFKVQEDTTVRVTFKSTTPEPVEDKFSITKNSPENGEIEITPAADAEGKYAKDTEITVTLTPAQGYEVATFTVGGVDKKADLQDGVYKFNITADTAITVSFSKIVEKYTLTVPASVDNGTVAVSPESADNKYDDGTEITVTLTPAQGYEVATFTVGGEDKKADLQDGVYKFNITADTAIAASFSKIIEKFTLTVPASVDNGTVKVEPASADNKYDEGTEITVTLTPAQGYEVATFTVGGVDKKADLQNNVYKFNITADTAIAASFSKIIEKFTLTVPASVDNGTVKVEPASADNKYDEGTEITVTLTPAQGYVVDTFSVGGVDKKADLLNNVYKFKITADTTISVTFKQHVHERDTEKGLQKGETTHWYLCKTCGEKMEEAEHTAKDATYQKEDGKHYQLCECGAKVNEAAHSAAEGAEWKQDTANNQHYKECVCGEHVDVAAHTAKDATYYKDTENNKHYQLCECGARVNEAAHSAAEGAEWKQDTANNQHYKECVCGEHVDAAAHSAKDATYYKDETNNKHYQLCECGAKVNESEHNLKINADKTKFECEQCDYEVAHTHDTQLQDTGADGHKTVCKTEGCGYESAVTAHSAKDATYYKDETNNKHYQLCECGAKVNESEHNLKINADKTKFECEQCDYEVAHTHDTQLQDTGANGHKTVCKTEGCGYESAVTAHSAKDDKWLHDDGDENTGKHYQLCVCGAKVNESTHDIDPEAYSDGTAGHHFECTVCDFKTAVAAHEQGSSEVKNKNASQHSYNCDVCNEEVLENHELTQYDFSDPTFEYQRCAKCDYFTTHRHTLQTISDDNGYHHVECTNTRSGVKCTYKSEPVPCDMQWTKLENEKEGHKGSCPTCGYTIESEPHDALGQGGACSKCGYKESEEHICKDEPENGFYDGICDICGKNFNDTWSFDAATGTINMYNGNYEKVIIPSAIDGKNVTTMTADSSGNKGFRGNTTITHIIVPASITSLPQHAFNGCSNLISAVILANVAELPASCFQSCKTLSTLVLSASITRIHKNAFGLTSSGLANGLKTIYYVGTQDAWNTLKNSVDVDNGKAKTVLDGVTNIYIFSSEKEIGKWHWKDGAENMIPELWN